MSWPWSELGLSGPANLTEIRRAYALRLKDAHPEENAEAFQRLHSAYQTACRMARQQKRRSVPPPEKESPHAAEPEKPPEEPESGWDYDKLLEREKPPGEGRQKGGPQEEEWDYDELLKGGKAPEEKRREERPQEENWDYDELLEEGEEAPKEAGKEALKASQKDWDYERLFAEGAAEAESARRRKIEAFRRKNQERYKAIEQEQRHHAEDEEAVWSAVMAATHAIELLHSISAPVSEWRRFLDSSVFWNVKSNLDFIFALEDFLEKTAAYLPMEIKAAFFSAYGFENGPVGGEYQRLYRLLGGRMKTRKRFRPVIQWFRPGTNPGVRVLAVLWMVFILVTGLWGFFGTFFRDGHEEDAAPWAEQCQAWLEEDWGVEFLRPFPDKQFRYRADTAGEDMREACVYAPADHPDWYFFAYEDGERDTKAPAASPGYGSNYPDRMIMGCLDRFAEEHGLDLDYDSAHGGFNETLGETPGAYLFQLPLSGAGEVITALGARLAALKELYGYQKTPPEFEIFLCYGDVNFYSCLSSEQDFDADYARAVYENKWGPNVCRYIAEETGAAAESFGADNYVLIEEGTAALEGETFFWVSALEKPPGGSVLAHYFLSQDGAELYYFPEDWLERTGLTLADLRHGEPETRVAEDLGRHGEILVWNHVK